MIRQYWVIVMACLWLACVTVVPQAQETGFTPLFNSKDLTGWKARQITVNLNGVTITDGNLDAVKDEELLSRHRDLSRPEGSRGIANTRGHIGLLGHGTRVEFRNIRIREL